MCCSTRVVPWDEEIATAILATGLFVPTGEWYWVRQVPEEAAFVKAEHNGDSLYLTISPAIGSWDGHHGKRVTASVMYEVACKYAEKVGGEVRQERINVPQCQDGATSRLLASYPSVRFDYANLCAGFQEAFGVSV